MECLNHFNLKYFKTVEPWVLLEIKQHAKIEFEGRENVKKY